MALTGEAGCSGSLTKSDDPDDPNDVEQPRRLIATSHSKSTSSKWPRAIFQVKKHFAKIEPVN